LARKRDATFGGLSGGQRQRLVGHRGLVAVTAAWSYVFTTRLPVRASDPRTGAVYVAGLLVLLAALVFQSPFYGFHALAAYVHSFGYLRGRWRFAGVGVTVALIAYAQIGGRLVHLTRSTLLALLGLVVVNAVLTGGFTYFGALTAQQSARRRQVISELEQANRRLAEALEENAGLQVQLLAQAREAGMIDERQRMAREIHDTLAQGLTGIVAQLEAADATDGAVARGHLSAADSWPGRALPRPAGRCRRCVRSRWSTRTCQTPCAIWPSGGPRRPASQSAPTPPLTRGRCCPTAKWRCSGWRRRRLPTWPSMRRRPPWCSHCPTWTMWWCAVRDDGAGFSPEAHRSGFGLAAMVRRVSGTLAVESAPGEGTALSARVPAIPVEATA
jgi:signal transduction histidine kinase